jgi:hypothetical protein
MDTSKLLEMRGNTYGPFDHNARVTQAMFLIALSGIRASDLNHVHKEAIHMICHKISRITNGDPNYADSWDDIAGYAKLVSDYIAGLKTPPKTIGDMAQKFNPSGPLPIIEEGEKDNKGEYIR